MNKKYYLISALVLAFTIFGGISVYANTPKTVIILSISSLNILYFAFKKSYIPDESRERIFPIDNTNNKWVYLSKHIKKLI